MKRLSMMLPLLTLLAPSLAGADPAPAADVLITFEAELVRTSSTNFKPAVKRWIDSYQYDGPCVESNDWEDCDEIRFGLATHAGPLCTDLDPIELYYAPDEDRGDDIRSKLTGNIPNSQLCSDWDFQNHDTAAQAMWETHFPATTSATDPQLNQYWERPHLNFWAVLDIPQSANGDDDNRVINSLRTVCDMYEGLNGLPSLPTWVMAERFAGDPEVLYGGLLAAAGGTGECEIRTGNSWDPLDVCAHVYDMSVGENTIRANINSGKYRCEAGSEIYSTGNMNYENAPGNQGLNVIECHLVGEDFNNNCSSTGGIKTNLFGIFRCIRQMPRGVAAEDATIRYCEDPDDEDSCETLSEADGDIEFIDENKTLFVLTDIDKCTADGIEIVQCEPDLPCDTNLEGRCADGLTVCTNGVETCEPKYDGYPEICNGLDDDCDGLVDNMENSWAKPDYSAYALPEDHLGLDCNLIDVCVCPDGATDTHDGDSFDSYLDSWSAVCACGENLSPDTPAPREETQFDNESACSAVATDAVPGSFLGLLVLGFAGLFRRRF